MSGALRLAVLFALATHGMAQADTSGGDWPVTTPADQASPADLVRMAADFPHSGLMQLRVAGALLEDDPPAAAAALWRFVNMGGVLSEAGQTQVRSAFADNRWPLFAARMAYNAAPISRSEAAGEVPTDLGLIEGIVQVSFGEHLLVSSVTDRGVYARTPSGWERFAGEGIALGDGRLRMASPMGMAFDRTRGWVWIASSIVDQTPDAEGGFSGLVGVQRDRGEILWLSVDEGAQPGDVTLGPDGDIYLSDGAGGAVYVRRVGGVELQRLVEPGRLRSAQGMAISPDGSALIIADYSYGIARYDFQTGALDRLVNDAPDMLDGIDGLVRHGDDLIAIRNGVRPHAILRITTDPAGRRVLAVEAIERANPDWGEPTLGTISGERLYYIADARWADFGAGGVLDEAAAPRPTQIRLLDLSSPGDRAKNVADSSR